MSWRPAYLETFHSGDLEARVRDSRQLLRSCSICPRNCRVDRIAGEKGFCGASGMLLAAQARPHHGEEAALRGKAGSGTVFLSGCNLGCIFCQNWDMSRGQVGKALSPGDMAGVFQRLARAGCPNINLVTPTHFTPQLLEATCLLARTEGPHVPLVWNSGGYESVQTLGLLEGVVDIYMPDLKTLDSSSARDWFQAPDYPQAAKAALDEMVRQVREPVFDDSGLLRKGVLVRHLLMPGGTEDGEAILRYLAASYGRKVLVSLLGQYHPAGSAKGHPTLGSTPSGKDLDRLRKLASTLGLHLVS